MGKVITVDFRNDTLFAVERDDGVFVAVTPICAALGVDAQKQRKRIQDDPILVEGVCQAAFPSAGGAQETMCLRLDLVNGWLFTINEKLIRDEETRQKVLTYKRECHRVLFEHFYGKSQPTGQTIDPPQDAEEAEGPKIRMITEARHTFGVPAAAQLWFKLGLPVVPAMLREPVQPGFDFSLIKPASEEPRAA